MVYPTIKPPVNPGIIFQHEKSDLSIHESCVPTPTQNLHPLFGTPVHHYQWPWESEYQTSYRMPGTRDVGGRRPAWSACQMPPCGHLKRQVAYSDSYREGMCGHLPKLSEQPGGQALDKLYDPTPLPVVDKHFQRNYYRIDDPIGVMTQEEITKCRVTAKGLERITTREELENAYTPNYRYKEWVTQPQIDILRQLETPSSVCRLPEPDTRYYDLYHQVRMHRPSPKVSTVPAFVSCRALPIPMYQKVANNIPPVSAFPHFGKFNNYEMSGYPV